MSRAAGETERAVESLCAGLARGALGNIPRLVNARREVEVNIFRFDPATSYHSTARASWGVGMPRAVNHVAPRVPRPV